MLIQQLRELEAGGLVSREAFPEIPPRVVYSMTEYGMTLDLPLKVLCAWAKKLVDQRVGKPAGARKKTRSDEGDQG